MDFKKFLPKTILIPSLLLILVIGLGFWKSFSKEDPSPMEQPIENIPVKPTAENPSDEGVLVDDAAIQQQLDRDREEQKQTKYLKTKLEQTNLELEQEKATAQINKLKMENGGAFKESAVEGQKNIPEVKVEYIGGDSVKKEAILSIDGTSFQVKEKSSPIDNIQVVSISDSGVTLHFSAPQELTKTIDYKPE